jgi:inorganic pyrophosphatase
VSAPELTHFDISVCPSRLLLLHVSSWYKTPDDKPINAFGFDEQYLNVAETKKVIEETHEAWKKLRSGETEAGKLWTGK